MTLPRSALVNCQDTPWYHCIGRCVRRAHLCGRDHASGKSFEHRRGWIVQRLKHLAGIFAIDVAAYAVMSNHYHVVLHLDPARADNWSPDEVLRRWGQLFVGPELLRRFATDRGQIPDGELHRLAELVAMYRGRLKDLSWFMRVLNEWIARRANAEDECTGRFWEGRFKSQALLDERALLTAMAYVDLNPVRAGLVESPEDGEFTSIRERLGRHAAPGGGKRRPCAPLMPFDPSGRGPAAIPFELADYLELLDWMGRIVHPAKPGHIPEAAPPILARLGIRSRAFVGIARTFLREFGSAVGSAERLRRVCAQRRVRSIRGVRLARKVFVPLSES